MESVVKIVPQDIRFWCNHEKHMICIVLLFIIHDSIAAIEINLVKKTHVESVGHSLLKYKEDVSSFGCYTNIRIGEYNSSIFFHQI